MAPTRAAHATLALLTLLGPLAPGCARPAPKDLSESAAPDATGLALSDISARNVVLIHVDTLNAAHTPWYGYPRDTMPALFARPWMVVDGYAATASWTGSSTASALTGTDADAHGVLWSTFDGDDLGGGEVNRALTLPTLAEHLVEQGWVTALWSGNTFVTEVSGISRGFQQVTYKQKVNRVSNAGQLVEPAVAWLDTLPADQPFFLMLQPMDPHLPYSPDTLDLGTWVDLDGLFFELDPNDHHMEDQYRDLVADPETAAEANRQWIDLYDEQLLGLDRNIDALLVALEARGLLDDTLVVLAADHGEALGELDFEVAGHGKTYSPEALRAPLLFLAPGHPGSRVSCTSSGADLAPTLLRALGQPPMDSAAGLALQDGCRADTFSSFYLPDTLRFMSAMDESGLLLLDCAQAQLQGMDLATDPLGGALVDPGALPHLLPTLREGLERHRVLLDPGACAALLE